MRKASKFIVLLSFLVYASTLLCACVPPFIDGVIDAAEFFSDAVGYDIYSIDPNAEGGVSVSAGAELMLSDLTDNDEKNIEFRYYYSFKFTAKESTTLKTLAFVVETEEPAKLSFQLEHNTSIFNQSIELNKEKKILQFNELNLEIGSTDEVLITLSNPLLSNVRYRIDTMIFIK